MTSEGKIGVIIPAVLDHIDTELLDGIHTKASELGYDTLVFTNASKSHDFHPDTDYIIGEEKIYSLAANADVDGYIFAAGRFMKHELIRNITSMLKKTNKPCVVLAQPNDDFPCVYAEQTEGISRLTEHLILEHKCRRIYCLTGIRGFYEAEQRLKAFRDTIKKYGLDEAECRYFYGDFWKQSAAELADNIAAEKFPVPDAVVCANDTMALTLCEALKSHGIRVPEDILVTGYDGNIDAFLDFPPLATVSGSERILGEKGVIKLSEMITGKPAINVKTSEITVHFNRSCGCQTDHPHTIRNEFISRQLEFNRTFGECFLTSDFIVRLSNTSSLEEYIETVDSLAFLMPKWKHLSLCICQDWQGDFENTDKPENEDYSENMLLMMSKSRNSPECANEAFPTEYLLPSLMKKHTAKCIVFLPLHYGRKALGYCAAEYENGGSYIMEERCKSWCDSVSNGLIALRNKLYTDYIQRKNEEYSYFDTITGIFSLKGLMHIFPAFLKQAEKKGKCVQVIALSCRNTGKEDINSRTDNFWTLVANAVQMSCSDNEIAARINEGYFIIIRVLTEESERQRWSDEKILQVIRMVKSIQSQLRTLKVPDFVYEYGEVFPDKTPFDYIITEMITKLNEKRSCKRNSDYAAVLAELRLEIRANPQFDWNSDSIADEYGISKGYLMKLYKAQFGITFTDDLINVRLDKARKLLKSTNMRLAEIADNCGYNNIYHFMRQFKKRFGMTAIQYRDNS